MEKIYELIENLIKLLQEKKICYIEISSITNNQKDSINQENYELLEKLVKDKQKIIDKLSQNDIKFLNDFNEVKSILKVDDISKASLEKYPKFKIVKELISDIKELGNEIYKTDSISKIELNKNIEELRNEIKDIVSRKKVSNTYTNVYKQNQGSYYFDRKN